MARQDKGARDANPLDWDRTVLTYRHRETGDIYDLTVSVKESNFRNGNMIGVDMREVLPEFKHMKDHMKHAMYLSSGDSRKCCYNSIGNWKRKIFIMDNLSSASYFHAQWS